MISSTRPLALWLFFTCAMIAAMIMIGAITRLTESGLSMVEWRAMMDMLPPLSHDAWQAQFEKYQATPEYLLKNKGMALSQFQQIYFWEWLHRLWGRLIGLVYTVPLAWFWARGKIPPRLKPRFIVLLFLGGLQGFIGWFMVKSGLVNEPRVSHYRLALHLGAALLILSLLWAQALLLWPRIAIWRIRYAIILQGFRTRNLVALLSVILTMIWGAFVAGLDAGLIYNEFPLMGGHIIPSEFLFETPWWQNFLTNHATVQWMHRVLAMLSFVAVFSLALRLFRTNTPTVQRLGLFLGGVICLQIILGVTALLTQVMLYPAVLHQAGAVMVLLMLVGLLAASREKDLSQGDRDLSRNLIGP